MNSVLTLLGLIKSGSGSDYDLRNSFNRYFAATMPVANRDLQAILTRMIVESLIQSIGEETGLQKYEITPKGRDLLEEWMVSPEEPPDNLRSELYAKVVIARLIDRGADAAIIDIQQRSEINRMRQVTKQKQGANVTDVLIYDYAMHHIEADLRWMDLTCARPKESKKDIKQ